MAGTKGHKADMTKIKDWGIDDFVSYMENSNKIGLNSSRFNAVKKALAAVQAAEAKEATEESAIELITASSQLVKACESYIDKRTAASTEAGRDRLYVISNLKRLQEKRGKDLDPIRDARMARSYAGKTWKEVRKPEVAEVHLDDRMETVGGNSSVRYKIEYNGKKGFFTEEKPALGHEALLNRILERQQDPQIKDLLQKNSEWVLEMLGIDGAANHELLTKNLNDKIHSMKSREMDKETAEVCKNREELLKNPRAIHACQEIMEEKKKMDAAVGVGGLEYDGADIAKRNIATSRIAGLLGIDDIAAHSQKMVVWKDGRRIEGCFMEFAEGLDFNSNREEDNKLKEQMSFVPNAAYNKAESTLEIFDYICAQTDRHPGNIFYKLSDVGEDGMRQIVGLKGIDNDLSFNAKGDNGLRLANRVNELFFIDKDLAERVKKLDRNTLEYAVGDLLNKKEMDALEQRVEDLKKNLDKQMIQVSGDEWKLDKYDTSKYPKDLSASRLNKEEQNYVQGLRELEKNRNERNPVHKGGYIQKALDEVNQKIVQEKAEEAHILEGVKDLFAEAEGREAEHKTIKDVEKELKEEKEAARKQRAQDVVREREEKKAAPERMDFKQLAGQERKSNVRIGAYRDRQKEQKPLEKDRQARHEARMGKR